MTGMETLFLEAAKSLTGLVLSTAWGMANKPIDSHVKQLVFRASRQYVQNYTERHGTLKVICARMDAPVRLDEIFTPVQLLERSDLFYFASASKLEELFYKQGRGFELQGGGRKDGIVVANLYQYLMVLGGPGVGKSTFLRKVGLEALKGKSKHFQHKCIPVFLRLQVFNSNQITLKQLIEQEFETCGFPEPKRFTEVALQKGNLLVLLDGLDEIPPENMHSALLQIEALVDRYQKNRFIASCRTAAYRTGFQKFKDVAMAAFNDKQIEQFIKNWFRTEPQTAKECWELLKRSEYAAAKELAQTPLLLTLLCAVYSESQTFPQNRSSVYGEALDVLLKKWAAEKRLKRDPIYQELSPELEQILLTEVAYTSFITDDLFFSKKDVTYRIREFLVNTLNAPKHLDAEAVLHAIEVQQGILVERARDTYSFSHLTLQEYLVAQYIREHQQVHSLVLNHLTDRRWREVFLLIAGLMRGGADELLLQMERQAQSLILSPKLQALFTWADRITKYSQSPYKPATKRAVAIFFIRARIIDRAQAISKNHIIGQALNSTLTLIRSLDPNITIDIDRAITLGHARVRARDFDIDVDRAIASVKEMERLQIFSPANFTELIKDLKELKSKISDKNQNTDAKLVPAIQAKETWYKILKLNPESLLSKKENQELDSYFYIAELIVRCKEQAARVSPQVWADIEGRLIMPVSKPHSLEK